MREKASDHEKTSTGIVTEPTEGHGGLPPKLTQMQVAQRRLNPGKTDIPVSSLSPFTIRENLSFITPEQLVDEENLPRLTPLFHLREGVLYMIATNNTMKRRYIWSAFKLASRYKSDEGAAQQLIEFIAYQTDMKVPKHIEPGSWQILEIVFKFVFVHTQYATQNTVTRWMNGLIHYFENEADIDRVKRLITVFGPEKLYKHSVERRKFNDRQTLLAEVCTPNFQEIDEEPPPEGEYQPEAETEAKHEESKKYVEQPEDIDLPSVDLDQQRKEADEFDEPIDDEFFDVEEVLEAVQRGILLSLQLGSAIVRKDGRLSRQDLAVMNVRLTSHLVKAAQLMKQN